MFGKYIEVFYYAVLLMMGNDIAPQTVTQTVYSSLMAIFGSLYGAFLFGNMATLMDSMNRTQRILDKKNNFSEDLMKTLKLPEKLVIKVKKDRSVKQDQEVLAEDQGTFFELLSPNLKMNIKSCMYSKLLKDVPLLKRFDNLCISFLLEHLTEMRFIENDILI